MTRLLLTLALMGLLLSIACSTDSSSDDTGPDGDTDAQSEGGLDRDIIFKGGSTVGNPAAVDVIFSTEDDRGSVMWKEITLDISGVYFADGSWPNSNVGALLDPDDPNVLYPIMAEEKITLQLQVPALHSFGAIDFRLVSGTGFHAEGVTEDGTKVILDSTLYGVLPFSAAGNSFIWESEDKDKLIASIESGRIMRKEMLDLMEADDQGRLVINEYKNSSLLEEIDRNIISAFSLYRDKNDNGALDADELSNENLLAYGNPDRAADWDADWPAMECGDGWESSPRFGEPIYDISGFGDDYAVAVGPSAVYQWNGFNWSHLAEIEDESNTYAVWVRGINDVFVAGEYGIYNWDGQAWTKVFDRGELLLPMVRIYATSSDNAYAVSNQDIIQFDGNSWSKITPDKWPEGSDSYGKKSGNKTIYGFFDHERGMLVGASSKDDLWVYGEEMATGCNLFHYDGIAWTKETHLIEELRDAAYGMDPILEDDFAITSMWSTGKDELWFSSRNMVANFNGERFRIYSLSEEDLLIKLNKVHVNSKDDFWLSGTSCDYDSELFVCTSEEKKTVVVFDGQGFIDTEVETDAELTSLWGTSSDNMWIAGGQCSHGSGSESCWGEIQHYDGQEYSGGTKDDVIIVGRPQKIWGDSSDNAYMITLEGQLLGYNGAEWLELEKIGDVEVDWVYDVSTLAANDAYMLTSLESGNTAVAHWDGNSFTKVFQSEPVPGQYEKFSMYNIFVTSANDIWVSGVLDLGDGEPAIGHWDGEKLEVQTFSRDDGARPFGFLKGTGPDNIWAMSYNEHHGFLVHWNGEKWKRQAIKATTWNHHLTDIAVLGEDNIIGTAMGQMFRYDGVKWEEFDTGLEGVRILSLWVTSPDNVYGVGNEGAVVKYDGESWTKIPVCMDISLSTVWGSGGNELWVGGQNGTLLHYSAE